MQRNQPGFFNGVTTPVSTGDDLLERVIKTQAKLKQHITTNERSNLCATLLFFLAIAGIVSPLAVNSRVESPSIETRGTVICLLSLSPILFLLIFSLNGKRITQKDNEFVEREVKPLLEELHRWDETSTQYRRFKMLDSADGFFGSRYFVKADYYIETEARIFIENARRHADRDYLWMLERAGVDDFRGEFNRPRNELYKVLEGINLDLLQAFLRDAAKRLTPGVKNEPKKVAALS